MLFRRYLSDLEEWMERPDRKPLIVWGARQCGKTYLIREVFADKHFRNRTVYIDCRTEHDVCAYCETHPRATDVLNYISLRFDMEIDSGTLLIFDEVQECPAVITLMKYMCQDYREIPVIVTGSMVRIVLKRKKRGQNNGGFLFPVGKINELYMSPMSFDEYLFNRNRRMYDAVVESYNRKKPMDSETHALAMDIIYEYLLIGGMPEAVDTFLTTKSYNSTLRVLRELYNNYLNDMELYQASPESILRSKSIFTNVFRLLDRESSNFSPSMIEAGTRNRDMIQPLDWLKAAQVIRVSERLPEHVTLPLRSDGGVYRVYLGDMGMFSLQSGANPASFLSDDGRNAMSAIFFENYAAEELSARGIPLFNWHGKNDSEFEFVLEKDGEVVPVDTKKGRGKMNSLTRFRDHNRCRTAIKVSRNNYGFDEATGVLTVPLYQLFLVADEFSRTDVDGSIDKGL